MDSVHPPTGGRACVPAMGPTAWAMRAADVGKATSSAPG